MLVGFYVLRIEFFLSNFNETKCSIKKACRWLCRLSHKSRHSSQTSCAAVHAAVTAEKNQQYIYQAAQKRGLFPFVLKIYLFKPEQFP